MNHSVTDFPSISVITPTLNSARTLGRYFAAIEAQSYPRNLIEVIIADGGSTDTTTEIARSHGARIIANPLQTAEAGKAVALLSATNELVLLLDSDNVLVGGDWLQSMVGPFRWPRIIGAEPMRFCAEATDSLVDRYCAVAGVGDPLCLFLGNYDKYSAMTGTWTGLPVKYTKESYGLSFPLNQRMLPTVGANGTMYRACVLKTCLRDYFAAAGGYFKDIEVPYALARALPDAEFAKVEVAIRHLYCADVRDFVRKQRRRIRDYLAPRPAQGNGGDYPWGIIMSGKLHRFCIATVLTIPMVLQAVRAYRRSSDRASFFHPVACWLTLFTYGSNILLAHGRPLSRKGWKQ